MSALLSLMLLLYDTQFSKYWKLKKSSYGFVYKFITCSKNSKINDYYMIYDSLSVSLSFSPPPSSLFPLASSLSFISFLLALPYFCCVIFEIIVCPTSYDLL